MLLSLEPTTTLLFQGIYSAALQKKIALLDAFPLHSQGYYRYLGISPGPEPLAAEANGNPLGSRTGFSSGPLLALQHHDHSRTTSEQDLASLFFQQ